jgi:phage baseplate assembly protein W
MNIDYPLHFDNRGRTASTGLYDHVRDMIEQLLLTSPGERVNRPDFGSGLLQMVFAPNRVEIAATLQFSLQAAIERWLGNLIELRNLSIDVVETTLTITVEYEVRQTGEVRTDIFTGGA